MASNLQAIESLYQNEIEVYKNQIDELRKQNKSKDDKNAALIDKVQTLNDLIEKASVTNKDLYTAFDHVREENLKLQAYTGPQESVTSNLEVENEMALENVQKQYINLARDSVSWISDKDKLTQRIKFLERECERYTRDNLTLGKQVRHLLKALEEERGMIIRRSDPAKTRDPSKPISALDVIDDHLVTFESIEDLQRQNQKLLSLVKELSKNEEEKEPEVDAVDSQGLNDEIAELKSQLDVVKSDREKIMNAFNTLLKERDLFKILLCKTRDVEHMTPEIFQRMVSIACSSGPAISMEPESTNEKDAQIAELKEAMSQVQLALTDLREESERVRTEAARELKLKSELLEQSHMKILTESHQVETLRERNELLESNAKALLNEFDEARTKLQKLTFDLESKTDLLDQANQKITLESQKVQSLREENQLLESTNKDLMYELDESKNKLQNTIYELESANDSLEQVKRRVRSDQQKLEVLREKSEFVESKYQEVLKQLEEAGLQVHNLTNDLNLRVDELFRLKDEIKELQRLRNLERAERLDLSRRLRNISKSTKSVMHQSIVSSPVFRRTVIKVENPEPTVSEPVRVEEAVANEKLADTSPIVQQRIPVCVKLEPTTPIPVSVPAPESVIEPTPSVENAPPPAPASSIETTPSLELTSVLKRAPEPVSEPAPSRTSQKTEAPAGGPITLKRRKITINRNTAS